MRLPIIPLTLLLVLPFAACGGGGPGSAPALPGPGSASLSGAVTEIDGSTGGTGGVELILVETGERVVTAPNGSFAFRQAPTGSLTVKLTAAPGTAATLGEQTYTANCSACHGADGSGPPNARNATPQAFAAALSRAPMSSITLTTEEYDAVYAFLTDAPAPTPTPTPTPDPTPDPTPTPTPDPGETDGATLYGSLCAGCHGDFDTPANAAGGNRRVLGARVCTIEGSLSGTSVFPGGVPAMSSLQGLATTQIEAIAAYLNSQAVTGAERYEANCAGCHGVDGLGGRTHEGVLGEDAQEIREAIVEEPAMRYLTCLTASDVDAIGAYLSSQDNGGGDDDEGEDADEDEHHEGEDDQHDTGHDADEDEIDDGEEMGEVEVEVHRVQDGEHVHVRLRIRDGRLERADVSRSGHDERDAEVAMQRTAANDDPDMQGDIEMEVRDDRQRFQVEVDHATPSRGLEAVVIAPGGGEHSLGSLIVNALGEAAWEVRTGNGGALPFGVSDLTSLTDYGVVVRDATYGIDLLTGSVPEVPAGSEDGDALRRRGRALLTAYETGLEGYVEVRSRPEDGRERFELEAEHLAPGRAVEFFIEDPASPGTWLSLGTRSANVDGEAQLVLDTGDGAGLPGGVTAAADLVGLGVAIRDGTTGTLLLDGTVPPLVQD